MTFSASVRPNLPIAEAISCRRYLDYQSYYLRADITYDRVGLCLSPITRRKAYSLRTIKSALDNPKSSISDNGAAEPARVLLERLFEQTQKLEGQRTNGSKLSQNAQIEVNLQVLGTALQAALLALKRKEEDLENVEKTMLMVNNKLDSAKEKLEIREKEIAAAHSKYEKLVLELKGANSLLTSQASQIEDLKLQIRERDQEVAALQSALSLKEEEITKMSNTLAKKNEEVSTIEVELKSKAQLLDEAKEVVTKQEIEIQGLKYAVQEREEKLKVSTMDRKNEKEKLKVAEANLEKRTMQWLLAQEEIKKLAEFFSKNAKHSHETQEDFRRVKKVINDVRSELIFSQKSLALSRQKTEEQERLLEKELAELKEQKEIVMSYMESLKDALIEVESERVKFRVAEAHKKELEEDLSMEKELVVALQNELNSDRYSLSQANKDMASLQDELEKRKIGFEETHNLLRANEAELVETKLEIQHLKSEKASLQLLLEEKDLELCNSRKKLDEMGQEIVDLKMFLNSREKELIQASDLLKEKDEIALLMESELTETKRKASEAETVVKQIAELTNKLVISVKDDDLELFSLSRDMDDGSELHILKDSADDRGLQNKQLETELGLIKQDLREKEMEVMAVRRALAMKDEELKAILARLYDKERKLMKVKEEVTQDASDLKKMYALAHERIGERMIGDLAIEKLQLEAAQLEVEAATSALQKLAVMSRELLNKTSMAVEVDCDSHILQYDENCVATNEYFSEVKTGIAHLSNLSEQLVKQAEAGIACCCRLVDRSERVI